MHIYISLLLLYYNGPLPIIVIAFVSIKHCLKYCLLSILFTNKGASWGYNWQNRYKLTDWVNIKYSAIVYVENLEWRSVERLLGRISYIVILMRWWCPFCTRSTCLKVDSLVKTYFLSTCLPFLSNVFPCFRSANHRVSCTQTNILLTRRKSIFRSSWNSVLFHVIPCSYPLLTTLVIRG